MVFQNLFSMVSPIGFMKVCDNIVLFFFKPVVGPQIDVVLKWELNPDLQNLHPTPIRS